MTDEDSKALARRRFFWWNSNFFYVIAFGLACAVCIVICLIGLVEFVMFLHGDDGKLPLRRTEPYESYIPFAGIILGVLLANAMLYPFRGAFAYKESEKPGVPGMGPQPESRVWLQRADYSIEPGIAETAEAAWKAFKSYDWKAELAKQKKMKLTRDDVCPPGLGLGGPGELHFIHIMPSTEKYGAVLYMRSKPVKKKILGILPYNSVDREQHYNERFPLAKTRALIDAWFAQDEKKIVDLVK